MNVRQKLIQLYTDLEVDSSLEKFSNRKLLQKLTYLIEVFGIDLDFRFSWYIHGPYDRKLTMVLYDDDKEQSERQVADTFPDEKQKLSNLKKFLGRDITSSRSLELIVSLHYLYVLGRKNGTSDDEIIRKLMELKPHYSKEETQHYLKKIKGLVS